LRTRVGYCGGDKEKPTYRGMGDHTEAISIDYDPTVTNYSALLNYFWNGHRCDRNNFSVQYENAIFYRNEEQKKLAEESLQARAKKRGLTVEQVATKIRPIKEFTYAEKYHQKYAIRGDIRDALDEIYPDAKALADSTIATKLNAYLGEGIKARIGPFLKELPEYDLPEELETAIRKRLRP